MIYAKMAAFTCVVTPIKCGDNEDPCFELLKKALEVQNVVVGRKFLCLHFARFFLELNYKMTVK